MSHTFWASLAECPPNIFFSVRVSDADTRCLSMNSWKRKAAPPSSTSELTESPTITHYNRPSLVASHSPNINFTASNYKLIRVSDSCSQLVSDATPSSTILSITLNHVLLWVIDSGAILAMQSNSQPARIYTPRPTRYK